MSDINGTTGVAMVRAIVEGERGARKLVQLRDPHCRKGEEEVAEQSSGLRWEDHLFSFEPGLEDVWHPKSGISGSALGVCKPGPNNWATN